MRPFPVLPFGALWYVEPNATVVIAVAALILAGLHAVADPNARFFRAGLDGYHEAPLSISTNGTGSFQAVSNPTGDQLTYERQFSGLEGGNTLFAHVHIGQPGTTGGVMFFLCGGGGKPACPNTPGTVTGTVNASDIIGPSGQGVAAGEFQEAISAMRAGATYAKSILLYIRLAKFEDRSTQALFRPTGSRIREIL